MNNTPNSNNIKNILLNINNCLSIIIDISKEYHNQPNGYKLDYDKNIHKLENTIFILKEVPTFGYENAEKIRNFVLVTIDFSSQLLIILKKLKNKSLGNGRYSIFSYMKDSKKLSEIEKERILVGKTLMNDPNIKTILSS